MPKPSSTPNSARSFADPFSWLLSAFLLTALIAIAVSEYADDPGRQLVMVSLLLAAWAIWRRQVEAMLRKTRGLLEAEVRERTAELEEEITERQRIESQLRLWGQVIEATNNGVVITDATQENNPIVSVNPAFERITGYSAPEVLGRNGRFLEGDDRDQPALDELRAALREGRQCRVALRNYRKDGSPFWNELCVAPIRDANGRITHFIGVQNDITERKHYEARLEYQANYDELTQLPNRRLLQDRLRHAIAKAQRSGHWVVVLFLDLDRFKTVIDSLGHTIGDALLQAVAARLQGSVRKGDTVARLGGNEFVILVEDLPHEDLADIVARKLLETINSPFQVEGHELFITASIGVSLFPKDGEDVQTLLKNADAALHRVKEQGRNAIQFYATDMNTQALERLNLEIALRHALDRGELELYYQPQVELQTGQIIGVEALLRWRHPQRGMISPAQFVQIAEETGLIVPIGEWALRQACAQVKDWQEKGLPALRVAVNLSTRQFMQPGLINLIAQTLCETGLGPRYLELEITESLLMQDTEHAVTILHALKSMGVSLSIDDFGTGYSSLNYLKRFPIDRLKIDKSFVQEITTNPDDAAITLAVISMAHSLKLRVIAEGVETEGQLSFLRSRHCDELQGYYFSPPLPAAQIAQFLWKHRTLRLVSREEAAAPPPRTLLLVDDDANALVALRRMLSRDGYQILTANSGRQGLELLARHRIGVVVADQLMPNMNGTDFLRRVREIHPDTVRIILSGHSDMSTLIEAINEGAIYKFLAKPAPENTLRTTLREAFLLYQGKQHQEEIGQAVAYPSLVGKI